MENGDVSKARNRDERDDGKTDGGQGAEGVEPVIAVLFKMLTPPPKTPPKK